MIYLALTLCTTIGCSEIDTSKMIFETRNQCGSAAVDVVAGYRGGPVPLYYTFRCDDGSPRPACEIAPSLMAPEPVSAMGCIRFEAVNEPEPEISQPGRHRRHGRRRRHR